MAGRRWRKLPQHLRREVIRRAAKGASYMDIVAELDVPLGSVWRVLKPLGGVMRPEQWTPSPARLSLDERIEIRLGLERGESYRMIAARLSRSASTICREVKASGGKAAYKPVLAHQRAGAQARRPKPTKLSSNPRLCRRVIKDLSRLWSPEQIVAQLREEFCDDPSMWVSHETIYKSLYVQGRGELRKELTACLRTGRARRKPRGRVEKRGRIPAMVMISERPAEVEDRAVPGHWEGDLIMGKDHRSAIGTLVERSTRFVMLLHLPHDQRAETVRDAMTQAVQTLPEGVRRTLTWDQGRELCEHARFTVDTGVQVYFCDPHSPWQRGTNENTNGLLRQYFPKSTDLSVYTPQDLQAAADSLNGRPRKTLGWKTPAEKLDALLAAPAHPPSTSS